MFSWLTERRRARLLQSPFPSSWRDVLHRNVSAYRRLDDDEQTRLRELVQVFIEEKRWEGCGGLVLTDEHRVTIAGAACLLLLGRGHDLMHDVESILVYPSTVILPPPAASTFDGRPRVVEEGVAALGVAHRRGPVVLAWDAVVHGARNAEDGRNVVIHEMAHKIDFLDGDADGTPPLEGRGARQQWAAVCSEAFFAVQRGELPLLRDYAGTNEAEFFAVASEVFFEQPEQLARRAPALYGVLRDFYHLDLAARAAREP
ncbi:MAG: zinc-dependent peptidase [Kofleriaceae bacterium]